MSALDDTARAELKRLMGGKDAADVAGWGMALEATSAARSEVNIELNFPPNVEGLVLGCIDADFCK